MTSEMRYDTNDAKRSEGVLWTESRVRVGMATKLRHTDATLFMQSAD